MNRPGQLIQSDVLIDSSRVAVVRLTFEQMLHLANRLQRQALQTICRQSLAPQTLNVHLDPIGDLDLNEGHGQKEADATIGRAGRHVSRANHGPNERHCRLVTIAKNLQIGKFVSRDLSVQSDPFAQRERSALQDRKRPTIDRLEQTAAIDHRAVNEPIDRLEQRVETDRIVHQDLSVLIARLEQNDREQHELRVQLVRKGPAEEIGLHEQRAEREGHLAIELTEPSGRRLQEQIEMLNQRDAQVLRLQKNHPDLVRGFMKTMFSDLGMFRPMLMTISYKLMIATRSILTLRFLEIRANLNRVREDVEDVEDVLNPKGAMVPTHRLIREIQSMNAMTMMQMISSARIAGFHRGKMRSGR